MKFSALSQFGIIIATVAGVFAFRMLKTELARERRMEYPTEMIFKDGSFVGEKKAEFRSYNAIDIWELRNHTAAKYFHADTAVFEDNNSTLTLKRRMPADELPSGIDEAYMVEVFNNHRFKEAVDEQSVHPVNEVDDLFSRITTFITSDKDTIIAGQMTDHFIDIYAADFFVKRKNHLPGAIKEQHYGFHRFSEFIQIVSPCNTALNSGDVFTAAQKAAYHAEHRIMLAHPRNAPTAPGAKSPYRSI